MTHESQPASAVAEPEIQPANNHPTYSATQTTIASNAPLPVGACEAEDGEALRVRGQIPASLNTITLQALTAGVEQGTLKAKPNLPVLFVPRPEAKLNLPFFLSTYWSNPDKRRAYMDEYTNKIKAGLKKQRASVFENCDLLAEASNNLLPDDFKVVWKEAGLRSLSNVDNYIRVANADHLRKPRLQNHLPVTLGSLIDLVKWTEKEISECITAGIMRPDSTRTNLKEWIERYRGSNDIQQEDVQQEAVHDDEQQVQSPVYEAAFVVYLHRSLTKVDRDAIIKTLEGYAGETKRDDGGESPRLVVVRRVNEKAVRYDVVDRWCDKFGTVLGREGHGNELSPRSPTRIRREEDVLNLEE